ncbi:hypothetical protein F887_02000 [Acinetobacter sp. NIPH 2100]|nr:hypothetical protein F887_02000 [Acinetobacter sp. NIPH 2100]
MLQVTALRKVTLLRNFIPHTRDLAPWYGSYVMSNSVKKEKLYSSCDLSAKSTHILFCAKNMNQYTDYLYIQPIND